MLIPAGHGVQLDGVHSLHDGLGSGDRDLSLIIRFVLLRIQTSLDHESLSCDPLCLSIDGGRSFDQQVLCLRDGWECLYIRSCLSERHRERVNLELYPVMCTVHVFLKNTQNTYETISLKTSRPTSGPEVPRFAVSTVVANSL